MADVTSVPGYFSTSLLSDSKDLAHSVKVFGDKIQLAKRKRMLSIKRRRLDQDFERYQVKLNGKYLKGFFTDASYVLSSPLRWDSSEWATASFIAGGTGLFFLLDDEIQSEVQGKRSSTTDDISEIFEHFGNGTLTLPTIAGFYLYGRFSERKKVARTALLAAESFILTGLFATVIKSGVGRHRPYKDNNSRIFDGFSTNNSSFPSGHTATAFAIATVVAKEYEDVPLMVPFSYSVATLAGLSRINDNQHWASDVFFGATLGYLISKTILRLHSYKKGRHFTIYPRVNQKGGGLVLSSRF